jgi:hypothetical protein
MLGQKIIFASVIILIIILLWCWNLLANQPTLVCHNFNSIQFKTGDMILFHAYDNINPIFIGSYWGHVGIVYKDPYSDRPPLIFEAAKTSDMKNCPIEYMNGIIFTDLKTRLQKYPGFIACKILNKHVPIGIVRGMNEFIQYSKKYMYYNNDVFHNALMKKCGYKFTNATNCGELVLLSLVKLGLLPKKILDSCIAHHLLYVAHLTKLKNNNYSNPIELLFSPF